VDALLDQDVTEMRFAAHDLVRNNHTYDHRWHSIQAVLQSALAQPVARPCF
jgi:hypothetical protein